MIVDARGRRCPLPILDLARHIGDVPVGATLTVEADDPAAGPDVRAWCRMRGHEFAGVVPAADGTPGYVVRRVH
ncbi:MAG TPA: sulfurtransferase TusA family protein [Jatrophihabitans sp.]|nr:sulfurtransferase TusA family protein [Jatrophihabitans sp.]